MLNGASQQRDCPGFTPDSLLIRTPEQAVRNQFAAKLQNKTQITITIYFYFKKNPPLPHGKRRFAIHTSNNNFFYNGIMPCFFGGLLWLLFLAISNACMSL